MVETCLRVLADGAIRTLDITGGAPELHPEFRCLVEAGTALGRRVIDRCNLTVTRLPELPLDCRTFWPTTGWR